MACPSETSLQAFVDGELSPEEIEELSRHLDACDECRTLIGVVQPVPLDDDSTADRVGRYVLRRVLGQGGMGVVYEAVDPELHRVVALKVLRSDLGALQERLLGEARAMAMLSHPNVVTIYDVGRSTSPAGGQARVFIVMALVQGVSLRHWLAREPRTVPAILEAFEQAGEGLRAAHEAGLVHRDFKPENVFVANDGRVLVGDFGLAVALDDDTSEAAGSLAYMAPEQRRGEAVDARCDQYSFCLALREATRAAPSIPRWLARLLARGTMPEPADRFPTMAPLLEALHQGRARTRSRRVTLAAAVGFAGLAMSALVWARARDAPRQAECAAREAEVTAIWSPSVAKRTELAFESTKSPLAEGAWRRANAVLGDYTEAWRAAHRRTCESPRSRDPVANAALDQRTSCLGERLVILRALTASLEHVDAPMLEQVPAMLQLLPRVSACEDAREIAQLAPLPSPDKAAAVDATRQKIASAATTIAAGRYEEGLKQAGEAWGSANAVGYLPVLAEAYLWLGTAHGRLGHTRESEQALEQAASSASAGHAPVVAIRAWIQLMHFVGFEGKRYDDGSRYAEYAKAALESLPNAFELEAERLSWSRAMLLDRRRFGEALTVSRQELALIELRFGASHRLMAAALDGRAGVLAGLCDVRLALDPQEKACAILEKEYGSPHPQLALCLGNLAALHANLGEHAEAMAIKRRALEMFEHVPGHPNHIAMARRNMVRSLLALGRLDAARSELTLAATLSHRESDETSIILLRGELHRREGRIAEALVDHTLAVTRTEKGEESRRLEPLVALAETSLAAERYVEAAANAERAVAIARAVHGQSSCRVAEPLRVQAEALLASGHAEESLPLAGQALAGQTDPLARARTEFVVARALPAKRQSDARLLASSARDVAAGEAGDPKLVARIDAWLARLTQAP